MKGAPVLVFGWNKLWVDFFFLLSGFVLYPRLTSPTSITSLVRARAVRLFPIALIALTFSFLLESLSFLDERLTHHQGLTRAFGESRPLWTLLFAAALMQVFVPASMHWVGALWTLSAEWWANILAIVLKPGRSFNGIYALLVIGFPLAMYNFISHASGGHIYGLSLLGRSLTGFTLGMVLRKRYETHAHQDWAKLSIFTFFAIPTTIWAAWRFSETSGWLAAELLFPALIWCAATLQNPDSQSFVYKVAKRLGALSFGIYAYQQAIYELLVLAQRKLILNVNWESTLTILILGSVLLSYVSNRYLEPRLSPLIAKVIGVKTEIDTH